MNVDDPGFYTPIHFVRYDDKGTIIGNGIMAQGVVENERLTRGGILAGSGHWDTHYVDLTSNPPRLREKSGETHG